MKINKETFVKKKCKNDIVHLVASHNLLELHSFDKINARNKLFGNLNCLQHDVKQHL